MRLGLKEIPRYGLCRARALVVVFALCGMMTAWAVSQEAHGAKHNGQIYGSVKTGKGDAVAGAHVRLQERGAAHADERTSDGQGAYQFAGVEPGTYVLMAEKGGTKSEAVTVAVAGGGGQRADLVLEEPAAAARASGAATMEFSDTPQFKIAGVTDWTAAGGHGSDTALRASEAITKQALAFKPDGPVKGEGADEARAREAATKAPGNFDAQRRLGSLYLREGKYAQAADALKAAYAIRPDDRANEVELARACLGVGDVAEAQTHADHLLSEGNGADAHRLAGEIAEKQGDPVKAVAEYQKSVELDPSEENYFAWGSELLVHRAVWQAKTVFEQASARYPQSARLLTAYGATLFAGALYDDAAYKLCNASDLNPDDSESYEFLGKIEIAAPNPLPCVKDRLARYVKKWPASSKANYYSAMAVWKSGGGPAASEQTLGQVEGLLMRAVSLDSRCAECMLQLGNIAAARRRYEDAAAEYRKAIDIDPKLSEAHYRLGIAYDRLGKRDEAREQFAQHDQIEKDAAAEVYRQRRQVKQFIVVLPGSGTQAEN